MAPTFLDLSNLTFQMGLSDRPSSRFSPLTVATASKLFLYGGGESFTSSNFQYSDFWSFDLTTRNWTQHSVNVNVSRNGTIQSASENATFPGGRRGGNVWLDPCDNLIMFGGSLNLLNSTGVYLFNITTNTWRHIAETYTSSPLNRSTIAPVNRLGAFAWHSSNRTKTIISECFYEAVSQLNSHILTFNHFPTQWVAPSTLAVLCIWMTFGFSTIWLTPGRLCDFTTARLFLVR
jgi:hypothetical protein